LKEAKDTLLNAELAFKEVQQSKGLVQLDAQAKAMIESLTALRAQIAAKEVELHAMRSYATDSNPGVQIADRELASLRDQAARLEERSHSGGYTELGLRDVPSAGLEYLSAEHEVKYRQALFDLLIKQYDAAKLDEAKEAAIIQVVEPAIEPDHKSSPKRALITLLFTLAGCVAGMLIVLIKWWKDILYSDPIVAKLLKELRDALRVQTSASS